MVHIFSQHEAFSINSTFGINCSELLNFSLYSHLIHLPLAVPFPLPGKFRTFTG